MIYDENRQLAAVHAAGKNFMLVDASGIDQDLLKRTSEKESAYRKLWLAFFDSIAIEARTNPELQAQNIPKRFWKDAVEFMLAGATAIQIGTANFIDPAITVKVSEGINDYLERHGYTSVKDIIGALEV